MIQPLIKTSQFDEQFAMIAPGERKTTVAYYTHQGVDYHSAIKLCVAIDESRTIICPTCGANVRQLTHYVERPGLCCVDCLTRYEAAQQRQMEREVMSTKRGTATAQPVESKAL